ncbi:hypothetical protein F4680DRAFT_307051 [Xylaria scruposa]|nr:hypothetical protein F4680DRAFT_307051 [Xylaria scruposa]
MASRNISQIALLSTLITVPVLLASTLYYLLPSMRLKQNLQGQRGARTVHLEQLNPDNKEADTDIDIIAIHGLDTQSADTWKDKKTNFNWLHHLCLGPDHLDRVRVFTCDWPAALFQPTNLVQKTTLEYAKLIFEGIQQVRSRTNETQEFDRPILFIASCLGGIILMHALVDAKEKDSQYFHLRRATRGIVFLATPFRGNTSLEDVATWAKLVLRARASFLNTEVNRLLDTITGSNIDREDYINKFTRLCQDENSPCHVVTFYELGKTSLPSKVFPWLPLYFRQEKPLVNKSSASLDIVDAKPLHRSHVLMNKFCCSGCKDHQTVVTNVRNLVKKIRIGTPLKQADEWIRTCYYTRERLRIERLDGRELEMEHCYINLTMVQTSTAYANLRTKEVQDITNRRFPLSLQTQLQIDTPNKDILVELPTLFSPRKGPNHKMISPKRILIRGSAGVGKTTLCKKIIFEFKNGTWPEWNRLFDRVLWIPLRKLKGRGAPGYNFQNLFLDEYLRFSEDKETRAQVLSSALKDKKTLFLLDGLDEVSQDFSHDSDMFDFLQKLIEQSNVIITTRPYPAPPRNIDLELETMGFYPTQVKEYLQKNEEKSAHLIETFLQQRSILQSFVRIPVMLDALCFIWDREGKNLQPETKIETMTDIYRAIEKELWRKDVIRLRKQKDGEFLTSGHIKLAGRPQLEELVQDEIKFLERLAFTSLYKEVSEFETHHLQDAVRRLPILLDKTTPNLSFLRSSDPLSDSTQRSCHFIHLTFRDYFAARYFIRQLETKESLQYGNGSSDIIATTSCVEQHKYTARYDIMWRFVAGLLASKQNDELSRFFDTINKKPRDLLGPTHQRLIIHCLNELDPKNEFSLRKKMEDELQCWASGKYDMYERFRINTAYQFILHEQEFPPHILRRVLIGKKPSDEGITILTGLSSWSTIHPSIIDILSHSLKDPHSHSLSTGRTLQALENKTLSKSVVDLITPFVNSQDKYIRRTALKCLKNQTGLCFDTVESIGSSLHDSWDREITWHALKLLQNQSNLSPGIRNSIIALCGNPEIWDGTRRLACDILRAQPDLSKEIVVMLNDEDRDEKAAADHEVKIEAEANNEIHNLRMTMKNAFGDGSSLSEKSLETISSLLRIEDVQMKQKAVIAFHDFAPSAEKPLSAEMLQMITTMLKNGDETDGVVVREFVKLLGTHPDVSQDVIQLVAARLSSRELEEWDAAEPLLWSRPLQSEVLKSIITSAASADGVRERLLLNQPSLSSDILNLEGYIEVFRRSLFCSALSKHVAWVMVDQETSYIIDGVRKIPVTGRLNLSESEFTGVLW